MVMDKPTKRLPEPLRYSLVPIWKLKFDDYCKATQNRNLIVKVERNLVMMRWAMFGLASIGWVFLFSSFGLSPFWIVEQVLLKTWVSGVVIAVMVVLIYASYNALLNVYAEKKIIIPNYSKLLKQDDSIPVTVAPDPKDGFFTLGVDQSNEFMKWKFGAVEYNSNLAITGDSHLFGSQLLNTLMYGAIGADSNTLFVILNSEEGLEFSWLKYNYSNLLSKQNKLGEKYEDLYQDQWLAEFADLPKLPNVCVVEDYDIPKILDWLYEEYTRRQTLRQNNPLFEPETRIVVILDWGMSEKLNAKDNGARYSVLKSLVRADRRMKFNVIVICDPIKTWGDFEPTLKHFVSGLEFFHQAQMGKKEGKEKDDGTGFQHRTFDIPALNYKCKLHWKGASRVLSVLKCNSDTLAEHIYKRAGEDSPETFAMWQCMCNFLPYSDSTVGREKIRVNLTEAG